MSLTEDSHMQRTSEPIFLRYVFFVRKSVPCTGASWFSAGGWHRKRKDRGCRKIL